MKLPRRQLLQRLASAAIAAAIIPRRALAIDYPTRLVRLIVPYGPGTVPDITARLLGQGLSERLLQSFVIENRPGAGANIGTEAVVRAPADGYTLLYIATAQMISPSLYNKLSFNFIRDIAPVASIGRAPQIVSVHPSIPVHSIPELVAFARANPGKLNEGSLTGGSTHLTAELFKMSTGVNIVHVPYRSTGMTDLLSGQLQVSFETIGVQNEAVKAGTVRALALTSAKRWERLPDIPTVGDFLPGFEVNGVGGIGAPKGTPTEIIGTLNREINASLISKRYHELMADLGGSILVGSPAEYEKLIANEIEKWG